MEEKKINGKLISNPHLSDSLKELFLWKSGLSFIIGASCILLFSGCQTGSRWARTEMICLDPHYKLSMFQGDEVIVYQENGKIHMNQSYLVDFTTYEHEKLGDCDLLCITV
ncbi:hypothetical protein ACJX0J_027281, partial [Zea mays]